MSTRTASLNAPVGIQLLPALLRIMSGHSAKMARVETSVIDGLEVFLIVGISRLQFAKPRFELQDVQLQVDFDDLVIKSLLCRVGRAIFSYSCVARRKTGLRAEANLVDWL